MYKKGIGMRFRNVYSSQLGRVNLSRRRYCELMAGAASAALLTACGNSGTNGAAATNSDGSKQIAGGQPAAESPNIKWAQGLSGNILVTLAKKHGYFEDNGLSVEEIPLDPGGLQGVVQGTVDIASNWGTGTPLQMIANGDDMAIIGGHMMEGGMPIIGKTGCEWNGVQSFKGKTVAGEPYEYFTGKPLLELGIDPVKDVNYLKLENEIDGIAAVLNDEADYAILGTNCCYQAKNTDGIQILCWSDDCTPEYSCCRMVARKSWVEDNPNTVVLLNEALLRAQLYFEEHRDECIQTQADFLKTNYEYVEAYMGEADHYVINVEPLYNTVKDQWAFQKKMSLIDPNVDDAILENAIYKDLYKKSLDFCVENYYNDGPEFWDKQVDLYKRQTA